MMGCVRTCPFLKYHAHVLFNEKEKENISITIKTLVKKFWC